MRKRLTRLCVTTTNGCFKPQALEKLWHAQAQFVVGCHLAGRRLGCRQWLQMLTSVEGQPEKNLP